MSWRWSPAGGLMLAGAAFFALAVGYVWRRRRNPTAASLLVMLLAAMWWSLAYAFELSARDLDARELWGDLKYVGICLLAPAWLGFVFAYLGRIRWPNRLAGALLAVEPLAVLVLLANDGTRDLIRWYPSDAHPVAEPGPLFWIHFAYTDLVLLAGTAILVVSLARRSRAYRRQSAVLLAAQALPWIANLLFNLDVGPFGRLDLTPFAFIVFAATLVWGVFRFELLDVGPVARSQIFRTIGDPVLVLDLYGRLIDGNPAVEQLIRQPVASAVGQPVDDLLPVFAATLTRSGEPRLERPALSGAAGQGRPAGEVVLGGRTYDLAVSDLADRQGRPLGRLVVARDVTARRLAEQRLRTALDRERIAADRLVVALERERAAAEHLRSLDQLKSGFLQAVSHDLRTPLASVLGIGLTLQRSHRLLPPPDVDDLLARLTGNARRLDRILVGLLDLDRLARGIVEPRRERIDLGGLVATIVEEARRDLLAANPVQVDLAQVEVAVDPAKVERIVENLLVNATRHTPPGTPVWVRVEGSGAGALLTVADAGPGVPAEQRETIFEPFQRGAGVATYAPGSGVGLALVAQLAALHGGRAWVEQRPGGGASFRVLLPDGTEAGVEQPLRAVPG